MRFHLMLLAIAAVCLAQATSAFATDPCGRGGRRRMSPRVRFQTKRAEQTPWNAGYNNTEYGRPVALVVPPTAQTETRWSWGVAQTTRMPIWPQFGRGDGGVVYEGGGFGHRGTPRWPAHTDQFGVYYVRGPWGVLP